jgi:hypothetical protein
MGYASRQPLGRGENIRNRRHTPRPASVTTFRALDDWSRNNGIVVELTARHDDSTYQEVLMTQAEVDSAVHTLVASASDTARKSLLATLLGNLSDREKIDAVVKAVKQARPK